MTILVVVALPSIALAQRREARGTIVDSSTGHPLHGARVVITSADSTAHGAITDRRGRFLIRGLTEGPGILRASFIGYAAAVDTIVVPRTGLSIDTIRLVQGSVLVNDVLVTGKLLRSIQHNDTTTYNAAAFTITHNADADALIKQLPGVSIASGQVKAQGETVDKILVDGNPFFGNDVIATLTNLPADIIDKVEIYDTKSEEAKFTGMDERSTTKTINIVTHEDKRSGQFGKASGSYGLNRRYEGSGNYHRFDTARRFSVFALSNNTNVQNFSFEDLTEGFGSGSIIRAGASSYMVADESMQTFRNDVRSGVTRSHGLGTAFSTTFNGNSRFTTSYAVSDRLNEYASSMLRRYVNPALVDQTYAQQDSSSATIQSHRLATTLRYQIDSATLLTVDPVFSVQRSTDALSFLGNTRLSDALLNNTSSQTSGDATDLTLRGDLTLQHRFATPRRTMSLSIGTGTSSTRGQQALTASSIDNDNRRFGMIDQRGTRSAQSRTLSPTISFNEPLSQRGVLNLGLSGSHAYASSDRRVNRDDDSDGTYDNLISDLSNVFDQTTTRYRASSGYRWTDSVISISVGLDYQQLLLHGRSTFPYQLETSRTFSNVLPDFSFALPDLENGYLALSYRTSTTAPSISQMQDVVDNSNPLLLSRGNVDLRQSFEHAIDITGSVTLPELNGFAYLMGGVGLVKDRISLSTVIADRDTIVDGAALLQGAQLQRPVNIGGAFNARVDGYFYLGWDSTDVNVRLDAHINHDLSPGLINGVQNDAATTATSANIALTYYRDQYTNVSAYLGVSSTSVRNSLRSDLDATFAQVTGGVSLAWTFKDWFMIEADITNRQNNGLSEGFNQSIVLCNLAIKRRLFTDDRGEISFVVRDALNQNNDVSRVVNTVFAEDKQVMQLRRVAMLNLSYRFRDFGR